MANHADQRADKIHSVPRRDKRMHASQLDDSIHPSSRGQPCQLAFFLLIGHAQTQRLHDPIKL